MVSLNFSVGKTVAALTAESTDVSGFFFAAAAAAAAAASAAAAAVSISETMVEASFTHQMK